MPAKAIRSVSHLRYVKSEKARKNLGRKQYWNWMPTGPLRAPSSR